MSESTLWLPSDYPTEWDYEQTLTWKPKVKDRPRFTKQGRTYTPKETLDAERAIAEQWAGPRFEQPIAMGLDFTDTTITVRIAVVEDYLNRKLRGDLDNYQKLIWDGLNEHAYDDDRQVVSVQARKV